ncbi:hypothetical protein YSA_01114 [Pseudomonas putida ND6]|uniref:Uncharacterized protein n=1 Tax=Pseudomonas putida ND6 TaxID=231023 RepID=I3UPG1_PSEPU|nr:hypothetical protein YSA_01114 [Pseudomonas putida ND6]
MAAQAGRLASDNNPVNPRVHFAPARMQLSLDTCQGWRWPLPGHRHLHHIGIGPCRQRAGQLDPPVHRKLDRRRVGIAHRHALADSQGLAIGGVPVQLVGQHLRATGALQVACTTGTVLPAVQAHAHGHARRALERYGRTTQRCAEQPRGQRRLRAIIEHAVAGDTPHHQAPGNNLRRHREGTGGHCPQWGGQQHADASQATCQPAAHGSERQLDRDRVAVDPCGQARLADGLAVKVDGLGGAGTGRQGDGVVDRQQRRTPRVGIEVVRYKVARTIGERTGAAARLAVMQAGTHFDHGHRTCRAQDAHGAPPASQHLGIGGDEQGILGTEVQGTEVKPRRARRAIDLARRSQRQGRADTARHRGRLGLGSQRQAQACEDAI